MPSLYLFVHVPSLWVPSLQGAEIMDAEFAMCRVCNVSSLQGAEFARCRSGAEVVKSDRDTQKQNERKGRPA